MADSDCVFCRIVEGEIPSEKLYEDERVLAFHDIAPAAPVHFLVIPKTHIRTADEVREEHGDLIAHMFLTCTRLAREQGLVDPGYRIIMNMGEGGGQTAWHIHFHVLGGRQLTTLG
jgi:histidine triad (HIT) family protein